MVLFILKNVHIKDKKSMNTFLNQMIIRGIPERSF